VKKQVKVYPFNQLHTADLLIDAVYEGGLAGNVADDPISKLLPCGNQGGFRYVGRYDGFLKLCVLYSNMLDLDWPDSLDPETGRFIYYGDNKKPGHELHNTPKKGNMVLRDVFDRLHAGDRRSIPPFLVFTKSVKGRDVQFRGLAVPGTKDLSQLEDLVAVWRTKQDQGFQNYRSVFTILNEPIIQRKWINAVVNADPFMSQHAPPNWCTWVDNGQYTPLAAPKTTTFRSRQEQIPNKGKQIEIVQTIIDYYKNHPRKEYAFEKCAAEIAVLMDPNITDYDITRPWRDGGRDAVGKYRIGVDDSAIYVDYALEAKCKEFTSGSGVKETSRLISRLRHRQFGIFITTSYVSDQAYKEIIEDQHPVIILCAVDIAEILIKSGIQTINQVVQWLRSITPY
jgi:hypothetical protein